MNENKNTEKPTKNWFFNKKQNSEQVIEIPKQAQAPKQEVKAEDFIKPQGNPNQNQNRNNRNNNRGPSRSNPNRRPPQRAPRPNTSTNVAPNLQPVKLPPFNKEGQASLKIIPIGGTTTVQKNMYVYECGNDIIIMDCGVGFPDIYTPGVDVIIPDFTYVLENRERVKGVVITHGHDDHRSSLPYLLKEYAFDVYAMPFVKALIENALEEHTNLKTRTIHAMDPDQSLQLGVFKLTPFRVNHSIPDTMGFAIDTPQGRVFHNADYKFDWTPVMDKPFDVQKAARLAGEPPEGVLVLLSDCLGSTTDGYSTTERVIQSTFEKIMADSQGKQLFITTLSSNISRIQQAIAASVKYGRKVVLSGRSIRNTMSVAREMGYIDFPDDVFVDDRRAFKQNQGKLTYIITGSYGQKDSGLVRVALGDHSTITLEKGAVVIFSADPIPNSVGAVNMMIDQMYLKGAEIYYSDIQDNLHVSGHGIRGDLTLLANIVRPRFFLPIGGNVKHMRAYSEMMGEQGIEENRVLQLLDGQAVIFENGQVRLGERLKLKEVYVDGNLVGDVGTQVIEERLQMANDGMAVVVIAGEKIDVVTKGFIYVKESKKLLDGAKAIAKKVVDGSRDDPKKKAIVAKRIEQELGGYFLKETGRHPLVAVEVAE
jgi:ribonuclease J